MQLKTRQAAEMFSLSVRALHYYDKIGLVCPRHDPENGYRVYGFDEIAKLNAVCFLKELGFSLEETGKILSSGNYDLHDALKKQKKLIGLEMKRLSDRLDLIDRTLEKGDEIIMKTDNKAIFSAAELQNEKKLYADEVKKRWGNTDSYAEDRVKQSVMTDCEKSEEAEKANEIFSEFAAARHSDPESDKVKAIVRRWQDHITAYHYNCTKEILACLGQMYVSDRRFTDNIDRFGKGTALFMSKAIESYCR